MSITSNLKVSSRDALKLIEKGICVKVGSSVELSTKGRELLSNMKLRTKPMKKIKLSPDTSKTFMAFIGTNAAAILGVSFMGELPMPAPFSPQAALDFHDALAFLVNVITVVTPAVFFIAVTGTAKNTAAPSAT